MPIGASARKEAEESGQRTEAIHVFRCVTRMAHLDAIQADYEGGVLRLTVPVADKAKPRKIQVGGQDRTAIEA